MAPLHFRTSHAQRKTRARSGGALLLAWALLLVYGTLYPLRGWRAPARDPLALMLANARHPTSWSDLVTNLLVYVPLGMLLVQYPLRALPAWARLALATAAGALLSLGLELAQAWLPARTPSALDLALNALGTALGALLALAFAPRSVPGRRLRAWREAHFRTGPLADAGLLVLALWALSALLPLVPSLDPGNLRHGLHALHALLTDRGHFSWLGWGAHTAGLLALGLAFLTLQRYRSLAVSRFLAFATAVLLLEVPVVGRQLRPETLFALPVAGLLLAGLAPRRPETRLRAARVGFALAYVFDALRPGTQPLLAQGFNWIPFRAHVSHNLVGLLDLVAGLWPTMGLAWACLEGGGGRRAFVVGTLLVAAGAAGLEAFQTLLPGRAADVTDVLVALLGWLFPWLQAARAGLAPARALFPPARRRALLLGASALLAAGLVLLPFTAPPGAPGPAAPLPAPEQLPPVHLPRFRLAHPRLPAPGAAEIRELEAQHPAWIRTHLRIARGGAGKLMDAILMARIRPGSQDLDLLFSRLMRLRLRWRGHAQAYPLAYAYDWLYDRWRPDQRRRLAQRVVEAANYIITFIRRQALSPYNVYLYNSPLQALVACAIAAWHDLPEADRPMRWTWYYLERVVRPVWRQVMGRHGGWHEGGEYVGIGIGDAIYRIPALWRRATGEDWFATEPGLRGFADFLVYRTRPDGTHMRWGDGAFFDRRVPARVPLAMETGNRAAYSLRCPPPGLPSFRPWGPLTRDAFCDPSAIARLPLARYFDGLGLVVARSDWSRNATYVTFKAGDNFWSHVHLDQGAFTLFKGGPLAIDSGYYGPSYQSDHRFDYSAQTIAHNVVTVKDPEDTLPLPARKGRPPRPIANDGGQRRVGSGWGERAPVDLDEWQAARETYHTGRIVRYHADAALVAAVAELTPAYTNARSGLGTFADRTFRVRYYWRTFLYDRLHDLVVVYDDVVSADPAFEKRSLVHTLTRPVRIPGGFRVSVPPSKAPDRPAGAMRVRVLLPEDARLRFVGGPGREFWVDGRNYDAHGRIRALLARRRKNPPEPGSWRVEILPGRARAEDRFLMVLVPGIRDRWPRIERLGTAEAPGVRIEDANGRLEAVFPHAREGVRLTLATPAGRRTIDLTTARVPLRRPPGRLARLLAWLRRN